MAKRKADGGDDGTVLSESSGEATNGAPLQHVLIPEPVLLDIDELKEHPRNYRNHQDDQLIHIVHSLQEHGQYKNVVAARDKTILAGHGLVRAMRSLAMPQVRTVVLDLAPDDPRALRLLTGDNEISHLAEVDDRAFTELLREISKSSEDGLLGTGYDEKMLSALLMVTRPANEIEDQDAAAEWVGMPEYDEGENALRLVITFRSEDDRLRFCKEKEIEIRIKGRVAWSTVWPQPGRDDPGSVNFTASGEEVAAAEEVAQEETQA